MSGRTEGGGTECQPSLLAGLTHLEGLSCPSPARSLAMHLTRRTLIAVSLSLAFAFTPAATFAASPAPAKGENGMVVTAQHLATEVGVDVLKKGGNAVDAAV